MKRPKQHEIDSAARRLFQNSWPDAHPLRKQDEDYGIDFEVEIFKDGESTGAIFKIQLKGSRRPNYSVDGKIISFKLELNRAKYLIEQIEIPTAIILCDTTKELVYWNVLHLDQRLQKEYDHCKERGRKTITVHFETCNKLPDTIERLLNAFYKAGDFLALARVAKINPYAYSDKNLEVLHQKIRIVNDKTLMQLSNIQHSIRDLALNDGRWRIGEYTTFAELDSVAKGMLESTERIEVPVIGSYTIESPLGNYEIVNGFLAATNHRVLVVLNHPMHKIRKDYFFYSQVNAVTILSNEISLILPDEVITLFDIIDDCNDLEKFFKYIVDKRKPPEQMTNTARSVEMPNPLRQ